MSTDDPLVSLVRSGKDSELIALAVALDEKQISLGSSPVGLAGVSGVSDKLAAAAFSCFKSVKGALNEAGVAATLRTAATIREVERLDSPKVEITWTGPKAKGPLVTDSIAALERCLKECRDIGEILLVGYSLTVAKNSAMENIIDLLVEASRRHAKIQVVLHKDEGEKNRRELLKRWDVFASKPKIYTWEPPPEHPYTKLHAKCLVVDRLQMVVTSANYTFHGLESNIELGLLVRNQRLASAVHERFDHLMNSGVLREWKDGE